MAMAEDAASVLEEFVQNVANLPAEIAHLLEEIQAKDKSVQDCRIAINARDSSIQKFVKANGAGQVNPKEDTYAKNVLSNFDKAQSIQEEKYCLSDKAALLLDRQIKRLDMKIRDLQNEGAISIDPQLPSLLNNSSQSTRLGPLSTTTSAGATTPLHPLSGNATGPSTTIANNPLARLVQPQRSSRHSSPITTSLPAHITSGSLNNPNSTTPTNNNPPSQSTLLNPNSRTAGTTSTTRSPSTDPKRRRINPAHTHLSSLNSGSGSSSSLRQSSLGPGTSPKPSSGTGALVSNSRGSSAGPRPNAHKKPPRSGATPPHHQRIGHLNPAKKISASSSAGSSSSSYRRRQAKKLAGTSNKGSDAAETDLESLASGDDGGSNHHSHHHNDNANNHSGGDDVEMIAEVDDEGDEGEGDDRKYCTCRSVSYGNMVACDNEECAYEWFHWSCVGMTKEPVGTWFCDECRGKI